MHIQSKQVSVKVISWSSSRSESLNILLAMKSGKIATTRKTQTKKKQHQRRPMLAYTPCWSMWPAKVDCAWVRSVLSECHAERWITLPSLIMSSCSSLEEATIVQGSKLIWNFPRQSVTIDIEINIVMQRPCLACYACSLLDFNEGCTRPENASREVYGMEYWYIRSTIISNTTTTITINIRTLVGGGSFMNV